MEGIETGLTKFATKDDLKGFATKDDLTRLKSSLLQHMDEKFATKEDLNKGFRKVHDDITLALSNLIAIDAKLTKNINQHEKRITRLERRAGLVKA